VDVLHYVVRGVHASEIERRLGVQRVFAELIIVPTGQTDCIGAVIITGVGLSCLIHYFGDI
jgi:hypothetical protein